MAEPTASVFLSVSDTPEVFVNGHTVELYLADGTPLEACLVLPTDQAVAWAHALNEAICSAVAAAASGQERS